MNSLANNKTQAINTPARETDENKYANLAVAKDQETREKDGCKCHDSENVRDIKTVESESADGVATVETNVGEEQFTVKQRTTPVVGRVL